MGWGLGLGFFLKAFFLFSSVRKPEIFLFHSLKAKIFFSEQSKNIFFSKQIYAQNVFFLNSYVRVFLEPNIHGYIVCMFVTVYTCMYILKLF